MQLIQITAHLGAALKAPARSHLHQLHAAPRPVLLQRQQQLLERIHPQMVIKQGAQLPQLQRLLRTDQGGFQDPLGINRIHGLDAEASHAER